MDLLNIFLLHYFLVDALHAEIVKRAITESRTVWLLLIFNFRLIFVCSYSYPY